MCPRCGVSPLEPRKKFCHNCKKGFEYHGYTPKSRECASCSDPALPGQGQKYCATHKLTRDGDSQSGLAQKAGKYSVTMDRLEEMEIEQGNRCAICGQVNSTGRSLSVDHNHSCCPGTKSCGKCVRGLLCDLCNRAVGLMRDNPSYLRSAADYLEKY